MAFTHNSTLAEHEPEWGSVDKTALPRVAHADEGEADKKSTWKYPHHWIKGAGGKGEDGVWTTGTMYLHAGGLNAAWSAAQGGRSGQKASPEVISHLQSHRKALKLDNDRNAIPPALATKPRRDRTPVCRGLAMQPEPPVGSKDGKGDQPAGAEPTVGKDRGGTAKDRGYLERDGGAFGCGLIRGVSLCTGQQEALGHECWIDGQFIDDLCRLTADHPKGVKSRFCHPELSGDGLGTYLGRLKDCRMDGGKCVGDLHLSAASRKSPEGDLGEYVMDLADEDPSAFGASIVFEHDEAAENEHWQANQQLVEQEDGQKRKQFVSPDPLNTRHLPHARIAELRAADVVDDPAANPDGLFMRGQELALEADRLLEYAMGLSDEGALATGAPALSYFSQIAPTRIRGFVERFMASHGLELKKKPAAEPGTPEGKPGAGKPAADNPGGAKGGAEEAPEKEDDDDDEGDDERDEGPDKPDKAGCPDGKDGTASVDGKPAEEHPAKAKVDGPDSASDEGEDLPSEPSGKLDSDEPEDREEHEESEEDEDDDEKKKKRKTSKQSGPAEAGGPGKISQDGRSECRRYIKAFGPIGGEWFAQGLTFEQAQVKRTEALAAENEALKARLTAIGADLGEATPVSFNPSPTEGKQPERKGIGLTREQRLANLGDNLAAFAKSIVLPTEPVKKQSGK